MSDEQTTKPPECGYLSFATLGALVLGIIAPLIVWTGKKDELSPYGAQMVLGMLNFELTILILILLLGYIPIIGFIIWMCAGLFNFVVCILAFVAIKKREPFKFISFKLLQK